METERLAIAADKRRASPSQRTRERAGREMAAMQLPTSEGIQQTQYYQQSRKCLALNPENAGTSEMAALAVAVAEI